MHTDSLLLREDASDVSHNTGLVEGWLSVYKKDVSVVHMSVNDLAPNRELISKTSALIRCHGLKMVSVACLLVLYDVCTWVHFRSINHILSESFDIHIRN